MTAPRTADVGRAVLGVLVVLRPDLPVRATGSPETDRVRRTVRVLGLRYLVQSIGGSLVHQPWVRAADAGTDVAHAVSMLAVARALPQHRRLAALSAVTAL